MPKEVSAGAVVFIKKDGEIYYLLLHYEAGHWDFPKGNVEQGEKEEETIKREVKEETGIEDIEIIQGFKEWIKYFYRREKEWVFKIVTFYLAETKTKEVKTSFEHTGYEWLEYKEGLERITYKNAKEILKKAHHHLMNQI